MAYLENLPNELLIRILCESQRSPTQLALISKPLHRFVTDYCYAHSTLHAYHRAVDGDRKVKGAWSWWRRLAPPICEVCPSTSPLTFAHHFDKIYHIYEQAKQQADATLLFWSRLIGGPEGMRQARLQLAPLGAQPDPFAMAAHFSTHWFPAQVALLNQTISAEPSLNLSDCGLSYLPPEIGQLTSLSSLNLSHNLLRTLPQEIAALPHLVHLDLSHNQFTDLPQLPSATLRRLFLSYNSLEVVPHALLSCTQLTELHLSHNRIATLPPEMGQLMHLTKLLVDHNLLSTLPEELSPSLTWLDLAYNRVERLPASMYQLPQLTHLFLSGNRIRSLDGAIGTLSALQVAFIDRNQLRALPVQLGSLAHLKRLDLSHNLLCSSDPICSQLKERRIMLLI